MFLMTREPSAVHCGSVGHLDVQHPAFLFSADLFSLPSNPMEKALDSSMEGPRPWERARVESFLDLEVISSGYAS